MNDANFAETFAFALTRLLLVTANTEWFAGSPPIVDIQGDFFTGQKVF